MKIRDGINLFGLGPRGNVRSASSGQTSLYEFKNSWSRSDHNPNIYSLSHLFGILVIGIWLLFGIWNLEFGISAWAENISSTELIERAKEYNNSIVEYEGEVVGDVMVRGGFAWVNVNDGKNAIGIWGRKDVITPLVKCKGDYNCKGDIIRVKGVFHRACPQHGGDLDIHMQEISKLKDGFQIAHRINFSKIATAFGLSIVALGLAILYVFKTRRK